MHSDRRDRHRHRSSHNEPDRDRDRERHRHKHHHRERNSKEEHGSPRGGPADRKVADDATVPMPMPMPAPPMPLAKPEDKDKGKDKDTEPKTSVAQFNSKTLNVSVLSASMNEHQQQIHRNLTGALVKFFHAVYAEAKKGSERQAPEGERLSDLRLFQEKLRGMPRW